MTNLFRFSAEHRQFNSDATLVRTDGAIDHAARLTFSLKAAWLLELVTFGSWTLMEVMVQYAKVPFLGVASGAACFQRATLGFYISPDSLRFEQVGSALGRTTAALASVASALRSEWVLDTPFGNIALVLVRVIVFLQQPFHLQMSIPRIYSRFRLTSIQLTSRGVVALLLGIKLLAMGIPSLLVSRRPGTCSALASGLKVSRIPKLQWDWETSVSLVRHGWPIQIAGTLLGVLTTMDRWIVLWRFGPEALGIFVWSAPASMVF